MSQRFSGAQNAPRTRLLWMGGLLAGLSLALAGCGASGSPSNARAEPTQPAQVRAATPAVIEPTLALPATATPVPPTITPMPAASPTVAPTQPPPATGDMEPQAGTPSFEADVQPIFAARCIKCHSGDNPPRGLRLDRYEDVMAGGTYRPVVLAGNADESPLIRRIKGIATPRMPFDGPPFLSDEQIATIEDWVAAGAPNN
ncbi:MAG: hypothetical protein GXP41_01775 [Chloroflexi bacterium]|nr:hypothetical protein [Chloroflexota bacterium]